MAFRASPASFTTHVCMRMRIYMRMSTCVCVYICAYIYAYVHVCMRIYAYMYTRMSTCVCVYMRIYTRMSTCVCVYVRTYIRVCPRSGQVLRVSQSMCVFVCVCTCVCISITREHFLYNKNVFSYCTTECVLLLLQDSKGTYMHMRFSPVVVREHIL